MREWSTRYAQKCPVIVQAELQKRHIKCVAYDPHVQGAGRLGIHSALYRLPRTVVVGTLASHAQGLHDGRVTVHSLWLPCQFTGTCRRVVWTW